MAGYTTKNLLTQQTVVGTEYRFKISENDATGFLKVQIDTDSTPAPGSDTASLETSFDGGATWATIDGPALVDGGAELHWKYDPSDANPTDVIGPLGRVRFTAASTINAIWVTRLT